MQKKLIALAIAGLSGAAFAQSNVTIYGVMDATYDNVKATGSAAGTAGTNYQSRSRITMNSSYFGLKGSESLGNGLTAAWQIENSVGENGGATNTVGATTYGMASRDTYVALAGGFGTIAAGTLTAPARALGAKMDVNAGATGIGANAALIGKIGGGSGAGYFDQRFANAAAYISPTFSGFNAVAAYVANENRSLDVAANTAATNTTGWTVGLNYDNGPIMAGYAWTQLKDKMANNGSTAATVTCLNTATGATSSVASVAACTALGAGYQAVGTTAAAASGLALTTGLGTVNIDKITNNRFAFKYSFPMGLTAGLLWDQTKASLAANGGNAKQTVWYLPVTYTFGANKVLFQYGKAGSVSGTAIAANTDYKAKHLVVGFEHSLSKRTTVKALYSAITNKNNAGYDFLYGVRAPNTTAPGAGINAGTDPKGYSVGIRHSF